MRFATPEYLYLLLLIPLLVAVYLYSSYRRHKQLKEYGDMELLKELGEKRQIILFSCQEREKWYC